MIMIYHDIPIYPDHPDHDPDDDDDDDDDDQIKSNQIKSRKVCRHSWTKAPLHRRPAHAKSSCMPLNISQLHLKSLFLTRFSEVIF